MQQSAVIICNTMDDKRRLVEKMRHFLPVDLCFTLEMGIIVKEKTK